MTDPKTRNRLLDLSVIATSALVLGGAVLVVAAVDASRPHAPMSPTSIVEGHAPAANGTLAGVNGAASVRSPARIAPPGPGTAPVAGLIKTPTPARKVVVVRRSRPS